MGCYMSTPDSRVFVTEGKGRNFAFATASCQGWRREQEDAEDCLPDFDDNASLFILCDGHGGAEVAQYTVDHLPEFLKNHPLYKEGKYMEALEKAFVEFDVQLQSRRVMKSLAELAERNFEEIYKEKKFKIIQMETGKEIELEKPQNNNNINKEEEQDNKSEEAAPEACTSDARGSSSGGSGAAGGSSSSNGESTIVDDVDPDTLRKEAQVPLKQLLEQYSDMTSKRVKGLRAAYQPSPVIRPKRDAGDELVDPKVSSSTSNESEKQSTSDTVDGAAATKSGDPQPSSSNGGDEPGPSSSSPLIETNLIKQVMLRYFTKDADNSDEDSEDDSEFDGNSSNEDGDDEDDENAGEGSSKKHRLKHKRSSKGTELSEDSDDVEDDTDDYDDSEEDSDEEEEDDDEQVDNEGDETDDDGQEAEDEEDFDAEEELSLDELAKLVPERPDARQHQAGSDSGCTVVVALIKDDKLYVASAGDSRCILIMRDGECKPMSFDHKPEDSRERSRINKAGGRVTEGRVNGGLNLSRAFGDFVYKNSKLDPKDQMITPCPDVRVADLDPKDVEYIFLACDGIWNSKRNQATANFIRKTAPTVDYNLVDICVKLFKDCMAPSTEGDGTGCDNMTCILVKFENPTQAKVEDSNENDLKTNQQEDSQSIDSTSCKRSSPSEETEQQQQQTSKRQCLDA